MTRAQVKSGDEEHSSPKKRASGRPCRLQVTPRWARRLSVAGLGLIYLWAPAALSQQDSGSENDQSAHSGLAAPDRPDFSRPTTSPTSEPKSLVPAPEPSISPEEPLVDLSPEGTGTGPHGDGRSGGDGGAGGEGGGNGGGGADPIIREVHEGDLVITTPGTVVDAVEVRGRIIVKANDVTVRNSLVVGGPAVTRDSALIEAWYGAANLQVEDTTIRATNPSAYLNGVSGANFSLTRVNISNVVDNVMIIGSNVTVRDSVLSATYHLDNDPNHPDGSHDDNIQIVNGSNIVIENNRMSGAFNTAIMIGQDGGKISDVRISNNSMSGGACTVNVHEKGRGPIARMSISGNTFGEGRHGTVCPMRLPTSSQVNVSGNTILGVPAQPQYF